MIFILSLQFIVRAKNEMTSAESHSMIMYKNNSLDSIIENVQFLRFTAYCEVTFAFQIHTQDLPWEEKGRIEETPFL